MRWEFGKVVLSTQDMAPDTVFCLYFIPGILGAKDGWNVLMLKHLMATPKDTDASQAMVSDTFLYPLASLQESI
jgi:hypothetical protein